MTDLQWQRVEEIRKRFQDRWYRHPDAYHLNTEQLQRDEEARKDVDFLLLVLGLTKDLRDIRDWGAYCANYSTTRLWDHLTCLLKRVDDMKEKEPEKNTETKKLVIWEIRYQINSIFYFYGNNNYLILLQLGTAFFFSKLLPLFSYLGEVDVRGIKEEEVPEKGFPLSLMELEDHLKNVRGSEQSKRIKELEEELARLKNSK